MGRTWRDVARPIIARVIAANPDLNKADPEGRKQLRKLIGEQYPFGERAMHPYKIWLDEIKIQLGERKFGTRNNNDSKEQLNLF